MRWAMANSSCCAVAYSRCPAVANFSRADIRFQASAICDDLLHLAGRPADRQEGEQLGLGPGDLLAEGRHAGLDLREPRVGPGPGGLGGARQLAEAAFGRGDGALEPLVGAFEGDEDGDALGHGRGNFV